MFDMREIKEIPVMMLEVGDRFMTRATAGYGKVLLKSVIEGKVSEVQVNLQYANGFELTTWIHPNVVVDREI